MKIKDCVDYIFYTDNLEGRDDRESAADSFKIIACRNCKEEYCNFDNFGQCSNSDLIEIEENIFNQFKSENEI